MSIGKTLLQFPGKHPIATMGIAGTAASAATIPKPGDALEEEIMKNYTGTPGGKYVFAELETVAKRKEYLEKKASPLIKEAYDQHTFGGSMIGGLGQGVGKAVGQAGIDIIRALVSAAGNAMRMGQTGLSAQQKMLVKRIINSDPMLKTYDAMHTGVLDNAYTTMVRTAPHVAEDPNVVTSFLREASQTGGTISYVTMKHLAEAERAFMEARSAARPIF
jgi:hypothetical protein